MKRRSGLVLASGLLLASLISTGFLPVSARSVAAPSAAGGNCQNYQLLIRPALGSGAAGHFGVMYRIRNISRSSCSLTGFPGVQLLNGSFASLPTHVTWSTSLAGHHPVTRVDLAPNGAAYFVLYWAEIPTGNQACPAAQYVMITPPNDRLPDVTYALTFGGKAYPITPCGGQISASPVEKAPFSI